MIVGETIITGGVDGTIKIWDYNVINEAEGDDDGNFYMKPTEEYKLPDLNGEPAIILNLIPLADEKWLV